MTKAKSVYNRVQQQKEPFFEIERCFCRTLKDVVALKKATRKYFYKWELESHLIRKYGKYLGKKSPVKMEKRWINPLIGQGVFVLQSLNKGDFICEYTGLITHEDKINPENRYVFNLAVGDDETGYVIDARYSGNLARTINHADKPNVEAVTIYIRGIPRVVYTAARPIKAGEELTVDYGEEYWHTWKKE